MATGGKRRRFINLTFLCIDAPPAGLGQTMLLSQILEAETASIFMKLVTRIARLRGNRFNQVLRRRSICPGIGEDGAFTR